MSRRAAARDAVLRWLYDSTINGQACPYIGQFSGSRFDLPDPFTENEIGAATMWLYDQGYMRGTKAGGVVVRPTITSDGEGVVERAQSVNDGKPAAGSTTVNITGSNNNVAAHSPNATQTAVTITAQQQEEILKLADALHAMAPSLGFTDEEQAEADQVEADLRELATRPDTGRLRSALDSVERLGIAAAKLTAAGHALLSMVHEVSHAFGQW